VLGFPPAKSEFLFQRTLAGRVHGVVQSYSDGRPALVFCTARKDTVTTAAAVAESAAKGASAGLVRSADQQRRLVAAAVTLQDRKLCELVKSGVGFHHAGLSLQDRKQVELLFMESCLPVLCTTTTLALGVNLPARLVVIKSIHCWRGAG
jgi:ATP-dependent DNA helicase HFM1/MER3